MVFQLKILNQDCFKEYKKLLTADVETAFAALRNQPKSVDEFKFYLANSAVHSSNIEGNTLSFDTYLKSSEFNLHLKTKEIKEIEELMNQSNGITFSVGRSIIADHNFLRKHFENRVQEIVECCYKNECHYFTLKKDFIECGVNKQLY